MEFLHAKNIHFPFKEYFGVCLCVGMHLRMCVIFFILCHSVTLKYIYLQLLISLLVFLKKFVKQNTSIGFDRLA